PRKKSKTGSDAHRYRSRGRERLRRITPPKHKPRGGEKQHNPDKDPQNRSRRQQIAADIRCRNGKQRKWPEKFPGKMTRAQKMERANGSHKEVEPKHRRTTDR